MGSKGLKPELSIVSRVEDTDGGWELTADLMVSLASLHDVTLLTYGSTGEEVCRTEVGDFNVPGVPAGEERRVTATCSEFPAIITADAAETPCSGAQIEIQYWVGTDDQRGVAPPGDAILWKDTIRRCDEALPPDRVVENVGAAGSPTSSGWLPSDTPLGNHKYINK